MTDELRPLFRLQIATPRTRLRLPHEDEIVALASLAGRGVHRPDERPFLTPWTDGTPRDREQFVLRENSRRLTEWTAEKWQLGLGVFAPDGEPLGMITARARDFAVVREVATSSWLGLPHQGHGLGYDARRGLLAFTFDHLEAEFATSEVFQDNHASRQVSRKLGYLPDGISRDARGAEVLVSDRLRLSRATWHKQDTSDVTVTGFDACRSAFGV